jgi:membrane protease YdiL (CAAX protease family)
MLDSQRGRLRFPLAMFTVLACIFGWIFFIARAVGVRSEPNQLPLGPIVAAAIVAAALGRVHLRAWGRRLVTVRTSPGWYLLAFLAPVAIMAVAVLVNSTFGAPLPTRAQLGGWPALLPTFLAFFVFIGIGEEAGWTAFAAPMVLERHRLIKAWLILATIRTVWHIPLMLSGELDPIVGIIGNFAFQFLVLWLWRRTGIWWLAAIWHATLNIVGSQFLFRMVEGADQVRLGVLMVAGYVVLGLAVWIYDLRRLESGPASDVPVIQRG